MLAVGRARDPALVATLDTMMPDPAGDPVHAHAPALGTPGGMPPRAAVDRAIVGMDPAKFRGKATLGGSTWALRPVAPCMVAAGTDLPHVAQDPDRVLRPVVLHEAEPHLGGTEKMPMALSKMSRAIWARSRSRHRRRIAACSAEAAAAAGGVPGPGA